MAKNITPHKQQLKLVDPPSNLNWAEQYGSEAFQSKIVGRLLKFAKGEWLAGKEEEVIPLGTKLVAAVHLLESGWQRWDNNKPVQIAVQGLRADGVEEPPRETLGYLDKEAWPEFNGSRRDPWQRTDWLLMANPQDGEIFTYSAFTDGGLGAVKQLIKEYGTNIRQQPDHIPIIELGSEWYKHAQYGKVFKPVFTVVDWRDADDVSFEPPDSEEEEEPRAAPRRAAAQKQAPAAKSKRR